MSLSLGGWGLLSLRNPFADLLALISGRGDLRSLLCLIVFAIVSFVLAYLTNPSENSFRAYLTEQSFRHHLSHLDAHLDDSPSSCNYIATSGSPAFHFATRASISLRTPKHVFHSFAVFTIAAMVPIPRQSHRHNQTHDNCIISDSWYIGAFGRWWRGGVFEAWYQDIITRSKDEESWTSGILTIKRLDVLHDYRVSLLPTNRFPAALNTPLHARLRALPQNLNATTHFTPSHVPSPSAAGSKEALLQHRPAPPLSSAPPLLLAPPPPLEQTPLLLDLSRQVTDTKSSVQELHNQLSECQSAASQSRAILQQEADIQRQRRKQDDLTRADLRSRTKFLEESKRSAESVKREADKKLKNAQILRDSASKRIQDLAVHLSTLQQQLHQDQDFLASRRAPTESDQELQLQALLQQKKMETKALEERITSLNRRSRTLEDKLVSEHSKLQFLQAHSQCYATQLSMPAEANPGFVQHPSGAMALSHYPPFQDRDRIHPESDLCLPNDLPLASIRDVSSKYASPIDTHSKAADHLLNAHEFRRLASNNVEQGSKAPIWLQRRDSWQLVSEFGLTCTPDEDPGIDAHLLTNPDESSLPFVEHPSTWSSVGHPFPYHLPERDQSRAFPMMMNEQGLTFRGESTLEPVFIQDPSHPSGIDSSSPAVPQTYDPLMLAFAPSPAERQAFQKALGLSTQRGPDHQSMKNDPSGAESDLRNLCPIRLRNPMQPKKVNFSPWADDDVGIHNPRASVMM